MKYSGGIKALPFGRAFYVFNIFKFIPTEKKTITEWIYSQNQNKLRQNGIAKVINDIVIKSPVLSWGSFRNFFKSPDENFSSYKNLINRLFCW